MAILRHLGRKFNLVGQTEVECARADMITDQLMDYKGSITDLVYNAGFSKELKQDWIDGKGTFAPRGSLKDRLMKLEKLVKDTVLCCIVLLLYFYCTVFCIVLLLYCTVQYVGLPIPTTNIFLSLGSWWLGKAPGLLARL